MNLSLVKIATSLEDSISLASLDQDSIGLVADYLSCRPCLTGQVPICQDDCICARCSFCVCPTLCANCSQKLCPGLATRCTSCDQFACAECVTACYLCNGYICTFCLYECPVCLDFACLNCARARYFDCCGRRIGNCCVKKCVKCDHEIAGGVVAIIAYRAWVSPAVTRAARTNNQDTLSAPSRVNHARMTMITFARSG